MLQRLYIENYVLIDHLDLEFKSGFSVITGETGAGKSILLGALSLILGQRADSHVIKIGSDKCIVEAEFDIHSYNLQAFFDENDLEFVPDCCLIRRELYSSGKSRAFINDSPVSLSLLKELSIKLIDIHSQHQNLLLGNDVFQLGVLDAVAKDEITLNKYKASFQHYNELQSSLRKMEEKARKAKEEEDYLRFQFEQLDLAGLKEGEQEELESEWEILNHAEEIKSGLAKIFNLLDADEQGINVSLKMALTQADSLQKVYSKLQEPIDRIHSCYVDMKDLAEELEVSQNDVEINPERMEQISDRMNQLYGLQQKHRVKDTHELIILKEELQHKLLVIDSFEDQIAETQKELSESEIKAQNLVDELSAFRSGVRQQIEERMVSRLVNLGIPKAVFQIKQDRKPMEAEGQDQITFLFSANKNVGPQPINQIASGGEISRIMLIIKSIIADYTSLPTLLFDEIDTGVSGEIAYKMGEIMKHIAMRRQVICITHLPQIAAKGKYHYKVYKKEQNDHNITEVKLLGENERLLEIAQMLSGANVSEAAIRNARTLLLENQI